MKELPSRERLTSLLSYNQETGELLWKARPIESFANERCGKAWNTKWAGKPAFTATDAKGHCIGAVNHNLFRAGRVIYKLMTGVDPDQVDHINGVYDDNRWVNLRSVPNNINQKNMKRSRSNSSGTTGVSWDKTKNSWAAAITVDRKAIHLGRFKDINDAIAVRKQAEVTYGFHPNHGRTST